MAHTAISLLLFWKSLCVTKHCVWPNTESTLWTGKRQTGSNRNALTPESEGIWGSPSVATGYRITGSLSHRDLFLNSCHFKLLHPDEPYPRMMNSCWDSVSIAGYSLQTYWRTVGITEGRPDCSECQDKNILKMIPCHKKKWVYF